MRIRLSARADAQLKDIWDHSADQWSEAQADKYLKTIHSAFAAASRTPSLFRPRPKLGEGIAALNAGSHVAYASIRSDEALILVVLHKSMDASRHLADDAS